MSIKPRVPRGVIEFGIVEQGDMLDTMMKPGGYRVDYFNRPDVMPADRLAFYVRGELENGARYSKRARTHMLAGFHVIMTDLDLHHLVAVYLDITWIGQPSRLAYEQMKSDLCQGLFCRVFAFCLADLAPCPAVITDLALLRASYPGFEVLAYDSRTKSVQRIELDPTDALAGRDNTRA